MSNVEHVLIVQNKFITASVTGQPNIRFNNGVVDRQGRFWAGATNGADFYAPDSSLFRLGPDSSVHLLNTGFVTSNGLNLSPDGKTLYFVDMFHHRILAYNHDLATCFGFKPGSKGWLSRDYGLSAARVEVERISH